MEDPYSEEKPSESEAPKGASKIPGRKRRLFLGGAAGLLLLCGCLLLLLAGLAVLDPFGWQIADRLAGRYDAAASAMPQDTAFYIGIDALAITPQKINRIIQPFLESAGQPDLNDAQDALDEFDQEMQAELGLTIQDDVMPWIGQYAGLGITDIQVSGLGDLQQLSLIAAISTRDRRASDAFLEKLAAAVTDSTSNSFSQQDHEGVTIYVMDTDDPLERLAFARSGGMVYFGTGLTAVQNAIDVRSGRSLAATDSYRSVVRELPGDRGMTVYLDGSRFQELTELAGSDVGAGISAGTLSLIDFESAAFALSFIDEGLQLDIVSNSGQDQLNPMVREMIERVPAAERADRMFPEETVLLISGNRLDLTWAAIRQGFAAQNSQADWDESMRLFEDEFGVNPDTELMYYLDGEWGLGLFPADGGLLAEQLDLAMGFAWLIGASDPAGLGQALNDLTDGLDFQGLAIQQQPLDDGFAYSVGLSAGDDPVLAYGLDGDQMFLASDLDTIQRLLSASGSSLAESDRYRRVWSAFPGGHTPAFYLDVQGLLDIIGSGMSGSDRQEFDEADSILQPLTFIAATSDAEISGDKLIRHFSTIFFIEPTE